MNERELEYLAHAASSAYRIAEVGSWLGRSAVAMAENTPGTLFCIDRWVWAERTDLYDVFKQNTAGLPIVAVQEESTQAAEYFLRAGIKFDMVFIDGDHVSPQIERDIQAWNMLVKDGGIFCGHDYGDPGWPDVKKAVDALVGPVRTIECIWTTEND